MTVNGVVSWFHAGTIAQTPIQTVVYLFNLYHQLTCDHYETSHRY